jgi:hypothetical protein
MGCFLSFCFFLFHFFLGPVVEHCPYIQLHMWDFAKGKKKQFNQIASSLLWHRVWCCCSYSLGAWKGKGKNEKNQREIASSQMHNTSRNARGTQRSTYAFCSSDESTMFSAMTCSFISKSPSFLMLEGGKEGVVVRAQE